MTLPDWTGVQADTPEFHDKVAQAMVVVEAAAQAPAHVDLQKLVRFWLLLAYEREMHKHGWCSKWGYFWLRPGAHAKVPQAADGRKE